MDVKKHNNYKKNCSNACNHATSNVLKFVFETVSSKDNFQYC